jgi:hypothetical protein
MAAGQPGDHFAVGNGEQLGQLAVWDGCAERDRHPVPLIEAPSLAHVGICVAARRRYR